jgi:hypothetical protein
VVVRPGERVSLIQDLTAWDLETRAGNGNVRWVSGRPFLGQNRANRWGVLPCGRSRNKPYCFGLGEAFAPGLVEADGPLRASLRVSTRVRRRVFFGDGDGDAVLVTAAFAGLGAGVGSAAKMLD